MKKKSTYYFVLLISLLFAFNNAYSVNINVGGTISSNTTWNADTVKVDSTVTVSNGVRLTIAPGTYVQFQGHYAIKVEGSLLARGTKTSRIYFAPKNLASGWAGIRYHYPDNANDSSFIEYCTLSYGKANTGGFFDRLGGAIYINGFSKILIRNNYISNNYASYHGGGIAVRYAAPRIVNNVIVNNTASSYGGGLYIAGANATMIMMNNTFAYNHAANSGGVYVSGSSGVYVYSSIVWGNTASTAPQLSSGITVGYSTVEGGFSGSNVLSSDPLFVSPTSGAGYSYNGLTADYHLQSGSPAIDKGYYWVQYYGVADFDALGDFRFDNDRADQGALEYISSTEVCGTISSNTTWSGNILVNCDVTVNNGKTLTILPGTKITFTGPYYIKNYGRILAQGDADNMINITAWNKTNGWKGFYYSSVSASNDTSKFEYCDISYGKNTYGGAFHIYNYSKVLIRNCILRNNFATNRGGAIYLSNSSAKIIGNLIINNEAKYYGGGVYIYGANSTIQPKLYNNTISRNKVSNNSYSGGVYKSGSTAPVFKNCIIWNNEDNSGNHLLSDNVYPSSINITYSDVEGGYSGTGNINTDPSFKSSTATAGASANTKNVNFTVQTGSPCIDAGTTTTSGMGLPSYDINGKQRVYNGRVDMGAYEDKSFLNVCGTISSSTVWDANTININCNVTIPSGVTVTIIPGTKVLFNGHYSIEVQGALVAKGRPGDSIIFTPANTSTGWDGIFVNYSNYHPSSANDSTIFDYCIFEYANRNPTTVNASGGALSLRMVREIRVTHCRFENNSVSTSSGYAYGSAISGVYLHTDPAGDPDRLFAYNKFVNNSGKNGTVFFNYSNITFRDNILSGNTNSSGAALKVQYAGGDFINNRINNNTGHYGGGIALTYMYQSYHSRIIDNIIANNEALYGAGILIKDVSPDLLNNTIVNNHASSSTYRGGGVVFDSDADAVLRSNIIYGNTYGGSSLPSQVSILDVSADPKFYNCDIQGGRPLFTGAGAGINYTGVYSSNYDVNPNFTSPSSGTGTGFSGSSADWSLQQGSALINAGYPNSQSMDLPLKDIEGNDRIYNGRIDVGAIENQQPIVSPCVISENTVWDADTIWVNCNVTINNTKTLLIKPGTKVVFSGYYGITVEGTIKAIGTSARRVEFLRDDTTSFSDLTVTTGGWDGVNFNSVLPVNDSSKFIYCVFKNGKAVGSTYEARKGGAMSIYNSSKVLIENCVFANNAAETAGGAISMESSNVDFRNNLLVNNYAENYGGAIHVDDVSSHFVNITVANNSTKTTGNTYGGGINVYGSTLYLENSILWGNEGSYQSGSQIRYYNSTASKIINCDIQYGQGSVGNGSSLAAYQDNLDVNPNFANPTAGAGISYDGLSANWKLQAYSPLVNKGKSLSNYPALDIYGNDRKVADTLDIGAYEVQMSRKFITSNPNSRSVCENTSTTFNVSMSIPANYQWHHNGLPVAGANSSSYTVSNVTVSDTGYYYCIMSTNDGSVISDTANLGIQFAPSVVSSPNSTSACIGDSTSFTVQASGTEPLVFTWQNSLGQLSSSTSADITVGTQTSSNAPNGYPSAFANYYWGNKLQFIIRASELTAAGLSAGPIGSVSFNVLNVNSCPALSNFAIYIGTTSQTSVSTTFQTGLNQVYSSPSYLPVSGWNKISLQNSFNWDGTSNLVIQICSNNSSWVNNGNASIALTSTSYYSSLSYYADNSNVCSGTSGSRVSTRPVIRLGGSANQGVSIYAIDSVLPTDASIYKCNVSNMCGSALSSGAQLTVNNPPSVVSIIGTADICENQSYTYTTSATGSGTINYQWYKDGSAISGANSVSYAMSSVSPGDAGVYYCKATNSCGADSTNQSVLSVNLLPTIMSQPLSTSACENQSAVMNIQASGSAPLSYQWKKGGVSVSGGNAQTLLLSPVSSGDAGSYECTVTNSCGSTTSSSATLTVLDPVSITSVSNSQTVCEGATVSLSATATGTAPLYYQWYKDGQSITGATSSTLNLYNVDTSDAASYYVLVSNSCNSVQSNLINVTINEPPTIDNQPSAVTACSGSVAQLSVSASGTAPFSYQWYKSGSPISGETNNNLIISSVSQSDAATYYVKVSNSCSSVNSQTAILTVNDPVSITYQSSSQTACAGSSISLSATVSGTTPISYQWYKDGSSIAGATNNTLNLSSIDTSDAATYYLEVSNSCNNTQSSSILLTVNESATITTQPVSTTTCEGSGAMLSVAASGTAPISYQWYKGGSAISGATSMNYLISSAQSSDAGSYYCKVSNTCGNETSNNATLTVNTPVSISSQSSSQAACSGTSVSLTTTVGGTSPINYQWYKDGDTIQGATNSTLNLSSVDTSDAATYHMVASNSCNSVQTSSIVLSINEAPAISTQPLSSTSCSGSSAMLSISATGTAPMSYQWYKGGTAVPNATANNYLIASTTSADAGSYYCTVTNTCGTQTSNTAVLTVNDPVIITSQSGDSTKCVGDANMFSISTSGTAPISYQWFHNGDTITGGSLATYSIAAVSSTDAGDYYCIATNSCASTQSSVKTLTVNTAPAISQQSGDTSICTGNSLSLNVNVTGSSPMNYQWYKNGSMIGGAIGSTYPMYQISSSDSGAYYCIATNTCGTAQSTNMQITVNSGPSIVYQSSDSSRCEGESMTFKVVAAGTPPLTYQWYFNQNQISGADSSIYHISNVTSADNGYYYAEISNMCSSVSSSNKYLTVHPTPIISLGNDTTFCDGGSVIIGPGYGYYCLWNNGQIASQLNVTDSGSYSATVTDQYGCQGYTDTVNINVLKPYAYQDICMVTVDSATGKNVVVWEKTPNVGIASFNIYKETNVSGVYALLGNRPYDSLSVMLDLASNPLVSAERYVLTVVDTCGNESTYSTAHRTMHLTVNKGQGNDWNLIWNAYEGFTPSSYKIYRADTSLNFVNIATVAGSSNYNYLYTDKNAPVNVTLYYYVEIVHPNGGCSASKGQTNYHTSRSNRANTGTANPSSLAPAFFGTPTSGVFPLDVHFFDQSSGDPTEWEWDFGDGSIDTVQNPTHTYSSIGVYSVSLIVKNASGMNSVAFQNYITVLTTGVAEIDDEFVVKVFPNPYSGKTNIAYALNKPRKVVLEIYNTVGMKVAELVNDKQMPGSYKYQFRAEDYGFSAGVYYMRMRVDDEIYTKKLVEVK